LNHHGIWNPLISNQETVQGSIYHLVRGFDIPYQLYLIFYVWYYIEIQRNSISNIHPEIKLGNGNIQDLKKLGHVVGVQFI
jgi:hypothetical protein